MLVRHDLKRRLPDEGFSFGEWYTAWEKATSLSEATGLLHRLLQVRVENDIQREERIVLLLQLADGWNSWHEDKDERSQSGSALSMRAFKLLASNFFDKQVMGIVRPGELLTSALLHFFRPHRSGPYSLHNGARHFDGSENVRLWALTDKYLEIFCRYLIEDPQRFQPKVVDILVATSRVSFLYQRRGRTLSEWEKIFSAETVSRLESIVLQRYPNLKNALLDGNEAAYALYLARAVGVKKLKT